VAAIKKTRHKSQLLFASIPLLFGVQQLAEGVLWHTLPNPEYANVQRTFTYVYVLFAQTVWPI
jgi:5-keto 4-deoxyuronate isomerase